MKRTDIWVGEGRKHGYRLKPNTIDLKIARYSYMKDLTHATYFRTYKDIHMYVHI